MSCLRNLCQLQGHEDIPCFLLEVLWWHFKFRPMIHLEIIFSYWLFFFAITLSSTGWQGSSTLKIFILSLCGVMAEDCCVTFSKHFALRSWPIYVCFLFSNGSLKYQTNGVLSLCFIIITPYHTFRVWFWSRIFRKAIGKQHPGLEVATWNNEVLPVNAWLFKRSWCLLYLLFKHLVQL